MKRTLLAFLIVFSLIMPLCAETSIGLLSVLSSLSCTALTAVRVLVQNVAYSSNKTERLRDFVSVNDTMLVADIASGDGEALVAVCDILEVDKEDRVRYAQLLRKNFDIIYPNLEVDAAYRAETLAEVAESL